MLRLSREIRFAINQSDSSPGNNGFGGVPPVVGLGHFLALQVTLGGSLSPDSSYLRNITEIDQQVRRQAVPIIARAVCAGSTYAAILQDAWHVLKDAWPGSRLTELLLKLSPFLSISIYAPEIQMIRLSQKFEFSAAHRLNNPALSDEQNRDTFGKCNNPHGHGHNYELEITLAGKPDDSGTIISIHELQRVVQQTVIDRFDHKFLNIEVPEFAELNPSVENIAMTIYRLLKQPLNRANTSLASVTVWETPKTWCEYSES